MIPSGDAADSTRNRESSERTKLRPATRLSKGAFVISMTTFVLALLALGCAFSLAWGPGGGGEGGFIILADFMIGIYVFSTLTFISLMTAVLAALHLRRARWFLIPTTLLAAFATWCLTHPETKPYADTFGPDDVPKLIRALQKDSGEDWQGDVFLLAHLGADAAPSLIQALNSDNGQTRLGAATALRDMAFRAKWVVPDLVLALNHKDPQVRAMVAAALGTACRENAEAEIAIPGLCRLLHDRDADVRWQAVGALKWMTLLGDGEHPEAPPALTQAVPSLVNALGSDDDAHVRAEAAEILGRMGRRAEIAEPALSKATRDKDERVRLEAREALTKVRPNRP
jgi:HEAT repeat protein